MQKNCMKRHFLRNFGWSGMIEKALWIEVRALKSRKNINVICGIAFNQ